MQGSDDWWLLVEDIVCPGSIIFVHSPSPELCRNQYCIFGISALHDVDSKAGASLWQYVIFPRTCDKLSDEIPRSSRTCRSRCTHMNRSTSEFVW